ncbi:hypothetical protein PIROE2DRAFT_19933 [Piromyces sp. E2]|nr:hypothetical protein PIROE2DRAFT_19933 [Piromyces sp. E2]|eukprot:OUM68008.1 hypothetical protein PIROE2DRAFT_19933 [Piromyces sp. E2]
MKSIIFYLVLIINLTYFSCSSPVNTITQIGNVLHQLSSLNSYVEKEYNEMFDQNNHFYHKDSFDYSIGHLFNGFMDEEDIFEIKLTPKIRYNLLTNRVRFDECFPLTFTFIQYTNVTIKLKIKMKYKIKIKVKNGFKFRVIN